MDCIATAPYSKGAHTPKEHLDLETVGPFWEFLKLLLKRCAIVQTTAFEFNTSAYLMQNDMPKLRGSYAPELQDYRQTPLQTNLAADSPLSAIFSFHRYVEKTHGVR